MTSKQQKLNSLRQQIQAIEQSQSSCMNLSEPSEHSEGSSFSDNLGDACAADAIEDEVQSASKDYARKAFEDKSLDSDSAFKRLVRLCMQQERSSSQMKSRLLKLGYSDQVSEEAIQRACRCGLIDDMRYADVLVRSRISQGRGIAGLERELSQLGINPYDVRAFQEATQEIDTDDELKRALDFLDKHPSHAKNLRDSAYRKLVMKGYSSSIASQAAKIWAG